MERGMGLLFSSLIPCSVRPFICAPAMTRYSSFFFDKQPGPRLSFKVPTVRFGCITLRSSTVETRKLLFSYRHNQSPQLQENYRL